MRGGGKEGRREVRGMGERDNELLESQHGGGRGAGTRHCRARHCLLLGCWVRERGRGGVGDGRRVVTVAESC